MNSSSLNMPNAIQHQHITNKVRNANKSLLPSYDRDAVTPRFSGDVGKTDMQNLFPNWWIKRHILPKERKERFESAHQNYKKLTTHFKEKSFSTTAIESVHSFISKAMTFPEGLRLDMTASDYNTYLKTLSVDQRERAEYSVDRFAQFYVDHYGGVFHRLESEQDWRTLLYFLNGLLEAPANKDIHITAQPIGVVTKNIFHLISPTHQPTQNLTKHPLWPVFESVVSYLKEASSVLPEKYQAQFNSTMAQSVLYPWVLSLPVSLSVKDDAAKKIVDFLALQLEQSLQVFKYSGPNAVSAEHVNLYTQRESRMVNNLLALTMVSANTLIGIKPYVGESPDSFLQRPEVINHTPFNHLVRDIQFGKHSDKKTKNETKTNNRTKNKALKSDAPKEWRSRFDRLQGDVENLVNSFTGATQQFEAFDEKKIAFRNVIYKGLSTRFLPQKIKGKSKQAQLHHQNKTQLEATLEEKGWSKRGGLKSTYWKAFHLPSTLSSLGDTPSTFVRDHYLPLLSALETPEAFRVASQLLKEADKAGSAEDFVELSQALKRVIEQEPLFFRGVIQHSFDAFVALLDQAFYSSQQVLLASNNVSATLTPATGKQKQDAYVAMKSQFLSELALPVMGLMPWLVVQSIHPITINYVTTILPEMMTALVKNNPLTPVLASDREGSTKLVSQPAWTSFKKTMLETIMRLMMLESDLRAGETPNAVIIKSIQNQLSIYEADLRQIEKPMFGPHLPVTHDNLDATIPDSFFKVKRT